MAHFRLEKGGFRWGDKGLCDKLLPRWVWDQINLQISSREGEGWWTEEAVGQDKRTKRRKSENVVAGVILLSFWAGKRKRKWKMWKMQCAASREKRQSKARKRVQWKLQMQIVYGAYVGMRVWCTLRMSNIDADLSFISASPSPLPLATDSGANSCHISSRKNTYIWRSKSVISRQKLKPSKFFLRHPLPHRMFRFEQALPPKGTSAKLILNICLRFPVWIFAYNYKNRVCLTDWIIK